MTRLPIVRDHMDTEVPTVSPDMEILEAVAFLLDHQVTGAPVVDAERRVVGMLSEKDCLKLLAAGADAEPPSGRVCKFMSTEVTTIPPEMDVYFAAGLFLHHVFRRLPVVEDGKLAGAITRLDILRVIRSNLD